MYKVILLNLGIFNFNPAKKLEEELNKIAGEGWELVTIWGAARQLFTVWKKK